MADKKTTSDSTISAGDYQPTEMDRILPDGTIRKNGKRKVTVEIPYIYGQNEQPDVVISINGKKTQIKRGIPVEVSPQVASVLRRSALLKHEADEFYYRNAQRSEE